MKAIPCRRDRGLGLVTEDSRLITATFDVDF